ncbi:YheC/YheD family protein [Paenibacillus sp. LjRoot153]|uniref:YheC/YheD family endospore coat-associated protein n=1 Tax=Paenibacillus sp. LjRoot153 TaxID=3342270 RepID=UPI003ECD9C8F
MSEPEIGILTNRNGNKFSESEFFLDMVREGRSLGAKVFLFSHLDIMPEKKQIRGFVPSATGGWKEGIFRWPDVVIDRCRKLDKPYKEMRRKDWFPYTSHKFTYKSKATRLFSNTPSLAKYIPKTVMFSTEKLRLMIREFPELYIKPSNGTGGCSILKVARNKEYFTLTGRNRVGNLVRTKLNSEATAIRWIKNWVFSERIRSGTFMIQQGLCLELMPHRVIDARMMIQKNAQGEWSVTGIGLRLGGKHSPTSNITWKGGKAIRFDEFMVRRFGREKAETIRQNCKKMAQLVVETIELKFGSMMEFGLDIGIDIYGKVWLIEVNPKPSRKIFLKTGQLELYKESVRRPLQYAIFLVNQQKTP